MGQGYLAEKEKESETRATLGSVRALKHIESMGTHTW